MFVEAAMSYTFRRRLSPVYAVVPLALSGLSAIQFHDVGHREVVVEVAHENLRNFSQEDEWTTWYEDFSTDVNIGIPDGEQLTLNDSSVIATKGTLRALVVNVGTPTRAPVPRALLSEPYSQAATRIRLMSRGMANVEFDVFGRDVIVPDVANICSDYQSISSAARDAISSEVTLLSYRSVDYVIPQLEGERCDWAGRAQLGGNTSWNFGSTSAAPAVSTIVHEWGHQYSLDHLRAIRCTKDGQDVHLVDRAGRGSGQCATAEYGGAFSIMGPSWANNSVALTFGERSQLGWLREAEERKVHEGVFTLGFDGPLSLLWLRNAEGDLFQVEFVKGFASPSAHGFSNPFTRIWHWFKDTPNYTHPGVMVKYVSNLVSWATYPAGYYAVGYVIDATPQTILSTDAAFRAGTSFVDPTGSLTVEVLSVADQSAEVRVRGVPFAPDLVQSVEATATDTRGIFDVSFQATVSDPPVTHYEIQVSKNYEFTDPQTFTVSASPGRVIIPNHINYWTIYRVAAVNSVGRGEFSVGKLLEWSKDAKLQGATSSGFKPTNSVVCKKRQKTRTFARSACPAGWRAVG
jgi:hypothetical protein